MKTEAQRGNELKKITPSRIPLEAIEAMGRAMAEGNEHYGVNNYRLGLSWSSVADHAIYHIYRFLHEEGGETEDNIGHALANLAILAYYKKRGVGLDDRFTIGDTRKTRERRSR